MFGGPRIAQNKDSKNEKRLGFSDLIEPRTENCFTHSCGLLQQKDTEQNQYRKKGTLGKIWRKPGINFQESFPFPIELCKTHLIPSAKSRH